MGGMHCPAIVENGKRTGFHIMDIASGRRGILARVQGDKGPGIGKYRVNLENFMK